MSRWVEGPQWVESTVRSGLWRMTVCGHNMKHSTAATRLATIVGIWMRPNVSSSHWPLLLREHQVQVLNRSAGCALAKIIENGGQQDMPVFHVRKYA